ncbi:hypothetical protein Mal64_10460 [Pseudobythopirellula maris]|uniref:Uncharacterized protein n=1 Tax=Pseudobythopirellula maris TaxID=2527991 RepID=A0A5C5ZSY2_9BACT|nr:hypothetical protein [Pseudobythopirellula maris]TWT90652.1 hypothetical protein Mal64_10460 [Pseudobythopirellula maris]
MALCLFFSALWARTQVRDEEGFSIGHAHHSQPNKTLTRHLEVHWYAGNLRVGCGYASLGPEYFLAGSGEAGMRSPSGFSFRFTDELEPPRFRDAPPGFDTGAHSGAKKGLLFANYWVAAPIGLPLALFALLPAAWFVRRLKRRGWRFSLAELGAAATAVAVVIGAVLWLKT